jgi:hypothetical protein
MSTIRRFKILNESVFLAATVAALAFGPAPAEAAIVSFMTPTGASVGGGPVSARADITTSNGSVLITLTDLLANPTDVGQLISDFFFTVANGNLTGSSQTGASAQEITVNSNGSTTLGPILNTVAAVDWAYSSTANTGLLDVLGPGAAGPEHLIIGPPGPGGIYSNANSLIAGNSAHNPFLNQTASFTITAPGVTAATTISSVVFSFGTTSGVNVPGVPVPTAIPEPASFATVGMGTLLGLGYAWRKRKRAVA